MDGTSLQVREWVEISSADGARHFTASEGGIILSALLVPLGEAKMVEAMSSLRAVKNRDNICRLVVLQADTALFMDSVRLGILLGQLLHLNIQVKLVLFLLCDSLRFESLVGNSVHDVEEGDEKV